MRELNICPIFDVTVPALLALTSLVSTDDGGGGGNEELLLEDDENGFVLASESCFSLWCWCAIDIGTNILR